MRIGCLRLAERARTRRPSARSSYGWPPRIAAVPLSVASRRSTPRPCARRCSSRSRSRCSLHPRGRFWPVDEPRRRRIRRCSGDADGNAAAARAGGRTSRPPRPRRHDRRSAPANRRRGARRRSTRGTTDTPGPSTEATPPLPRPRSRQGARAGHRDEPAIAAPSAPIASRAPPRSRCRRASTSPTRCSSARRAS